MVRDRGGEFLRRHLADPATRAAVEAITAEMRRAEQLTRWAEAGEREIHPGRGTSGPASQAAARTLLRNAEERHYWVVTLSYPDAGLEMATMDGWEDALADLDAAVARVPSDAAVELRLHVASSSEDQAIATATARAAEVVALTPTTAAAHPEAGRGVRGK